MKKSVLGLALLSAIVLTTPAVAQKVEKNDCCNAKTECTCKQMDRKGHKDGTREKARKFGKVNPFAELNLSDDQKSRIETLHKSIADSRKESMAAVKKARENKDTTFNPRSVQKQFRSNYLQELKGILTPEQYTQFLQNYYVNNSGEQGRMKMKQKSLKKAQKAKKMKRQIKFDGDRKMPQVKATAKKIN